MSLDLQAQPPSEASEAAPAERQELTLDERTPVLRLAARWLPVLGVGLVHVDAAPISGFAQLVFQFSIAAPLFWADRYLISPARLDRLLMLIFWTNAAGAVHSYSSPRAWTG